MGSIKGTKKTSYFWFDTDDDRLKVITDPSHRLYDRRVELPIDESMVESIANPTIGILEPIIVRKVGDFYEVVDGRQRVRSAREAKKRYPDRMIRIPAIPRTARDAEAARNATIANVQRRDDSQSVKGENAARMIEMGYSDDEVSAFYGVEWSTVSDWIAFSERATGNLKDALDSGLMTYTEARKTSRLKAATQNVVADRIKSEPVDRPKPGPKPGSMRVPKISITVKEPGNVIVSTKNLDEFFPDDLKTVIGEAEKIINDLINRSTKNQNEK